MVTEARLRMKDYRAANDIRVHGDTVTASKISVSNASSVGGERGRWSLCLAPCGGILLARDTIFVYVEVPAEPHVPKDLP